MHSAPLPFNEKARQLAVAELGLATPAPDSGFDGIVRLAAGALQAPLAAFSVLSDERLIFKSAIGFEPHGTGRGIGFCGHTVLQRQVLAVDDARQDPRFSGNPLVTGSPAIRYYLGAPVRAPGGTQVGAICVMDRQPRRSSDGDRRLIADLARQLENELLLRATQVRDPLTGLYSRDSFCELADPAWRRARGEGHHVSLLLFSVDRYLSFCRAWGRDGTNGVLQQVAQGIEQAIPGGDYVLGRLRDERFALLVTREHAGGARELGDSIRRSVEQHCRRWTERYGRTITLSVGHASDGDSGERDRSLTDLLERAQAVLVQAKSGTSRLAA